MDEEIIFKWDKECDTSRMTIRASPGVSVFEYIS